MEISEAKPTGNPVVAIFKRALGIPELSVIVPLVIFLLIVDQIHPAMLSKASLVVILRSMSYIGIIVVGQAMLMISGELDLSVGSLAALGGVFSAWLMSSSGLQWPVWQAIVVTLLAGAAIGLANGLITTKIGLPSFIVTLGMLWICRGFNYMISGGTYIYGIPKSVSTFGTVRPLGLYWSVFIFLALVVVADFLMRRSIWGSMVTATGGNKVAARVAGINTDMVKTICFITTSCLAATAGFLLMSSISTGDATTGGGWELWTIVSCVIGGVSLFGGVGTILGAALGVLFMQVIQSGLVVASVNIDWQNVVVGVILALAASVDLLRRRAKKY